MDLLVNDLSMHGQFADLGAFRESMSRVMEVRQIARRYGRELRCHRGMANAKVTSALLLPEALGALSTNDRRSVMQWLTRYGPFWDDERRHSPDDFMECNMAVVTDSAIGEAAMWCMSGVERRVVSFAPSEWEVTPLLVTWTLESGAARQTHVANHWSPPDVEVALQAAEIPPASWSQLAEYSVRRYSNIRFADDAFGGLSGHPFVPAAAERIRVLLGILDRFKVCFDPDGNRTTEGHQIYQDHFTGDAAWFTDSSDDEKVQFANELVFRHPDNPDVTLACPWHGKIKTGQLRIHFSWPVRSDQSLYVVYIGPKLTKR